MMKAKTTLYLPEPLHRRLKSLAGQRGTTITSLLAEGAGMVLDRYQGIADRETILRRAEEAEDALRRGLYEGPSVAREADDIVYGEPDAGERAPK